MPHTHQNVFVHAKSDGVICVAAATRNDPDARHLTVNDLTTNVISVPSDASRDLRPGIATALAGIIKSCPKHGWTDVLIELDPDVAETQTPCMVRFGKSKIIITTRATYNETSPTDPYVMRKKAAIDAVNAELARAQRARTAT